MPNVERLADKDSPLVVGEQINFFGDSITWQGGYVDLLAIHRLR